MNGGIRRFGGLVIGRKLGESFVLRYPDGHNKIVKVNKMTAEGAVLAVDDIEFDLTVQDSIVLDGLDESKSGLYLESSEGGRVLIRIIADDRIRVLRSELLK